MTVCTKERGKVFGEIKDGTFIENIYGSIVRKCWEAIPMHFINVSLDKYIVMPDHIHGIVIVKNKYVVGDADLRPLRRNDRRRMLLSKIIHGFKSSVSRHLHNIYCEPIWQRSYYDHVIRNEKDLIRIRTYIRENPKNY